MITTKEITHPYLNLMELFTCPTPHCKKAHTRQFNLLRIAAFNIARRHYSEIKRKVERVKPSSIESKTLEAFKKYAHGEAFEEFDFKCSFCKTRHYFKVNALTGDVTDAQRKVILRTPPEQLPHYSEIVPFKKNATH